jgi:hypothetical protein
MPTAPSFGANDNKVGGNIQVIGNRARAEIYRNRIDGNLQCKENRPRPAAAAIALAGTKKISAPVFEAEEQKVRKYVFLELTPAALC